MNWNSEQSTHRLTVGDCMAAVYYRYENRNRHDTIVASVQSSLFPTLEREDFSTIADAKAWCEQWMSFASELLELRKTVAVLRQQQHNDHADSAPHGTATRIALSA